MPEAFQSFRDFYPYLSEHENQTCRRFHFVGTSLVYGVLTSFALYRDMLRGRIPF